MLVSIVVSKAMGIELKAVLTGSMEPELPVGSLLIVAPTDFEKINVGDDVTFVADSNLTIVTHRVISKDNKDRKFTTQGIANNVADNPILYDNVVGVVRASIPMLGYIVIWLNTLMGKIIAIGIIALLFVLSMFTKDKKKEKEVS